MDVPGNAQDVAFVLEVAFGKADGDEMGLLAVVEMLMLAEGVVIADVDARVALVDAAFKIEVCTADDDTRGEEEDESEEMATATLELWTGTIAEVTAATLVALANEAEAVGGLSVAEGVAFAVVLNVGG